MANEGTHEEMIDANEAPKPKAKPKKATKLPKKFLSKKGALKLLNKLGKGYQCVTTGRHSTVSKISSEK